MDIITDGGLTAEYLVDRYGAYLSVTGEGLPAAAEYGCPATAPRARPRRLREAIAYTRTNIIELLAARAVAA